MVASPEYSIRVSSIGNAVVGNPEDYIATSAIRRHSGNTYTGDLTRDTFIVPAGTQAILEEIGMAARANGSNWQIELMCYRVENGVPTDLVAGPFISEPESGSGLSNFEADVGTILDAGEYILAFSPYTGNGTDVYHSDLVAMTYKSDAHAPDPFEDDGTSNGRPMLWGILAIAGNNTSISSVNGNNVIQQSQPISITGSLLKGPDGTGVTTTKLISENGQETNLSQTSVTPQVITCAGMDFTLTSLPFGDAMIEVSIDGVPLPQHPVTIVPANGWQVKTLVSIDINLLAKSIPGISNGWQLMTQSGYQDSNNELFENSDLEIDPALKYSPVKLVRWAYDATNHTWDSGAYEIVTPDAPTDPDEPDPPDPTDPPDPPDPTDPPVDPDPPDPPTDPDPPDPPDNGDFSITGISEISAIVRIFGSNNGATVFVAMRDTAPYGPNDQDEIRNGVDAVWSRSAENASQLSFLVNSLPKPSTKYYVGSFERLASVDGPVASGDFNTHALPNDPSGSPETIVGE